MHSFMNVIIDTVINETLVAAKWTIAGRGKKELSISKSIFTTSLGFNFRRCLSLHDSARLSEHPEGLPLPCAPSSPDRPLRTVHVHPDSATGVPDA